MRMGSDGQKLFVRRFSERELSAKELPDGAEPRPAGWYGTRGDAWRLKDHVLTYLGASDAPLATAVSRFNDLLVSGEA